MRVVVWVEAWQLQCCGEPFAVGQDVSWNLSSAVDREWLQNALDVETARRIDYVEDHHDPVGSPTTRGTVVSIKSACCEYGPPPGTDGTVLYPVVGSGQQRETSHADGRDPEMKPLSFIGYVVELHVPESGLGDTSS